jgi:hypothetical protein
MTAHPAATARAGRNPTLAAATLIANYPAARELLAGDRPYLTPRVVCQLAHTSPERQR